MPEDSDRRLYSFKISNTGSITSVYTGGSSTTPSYKVTGGSILGNENRFGIRSSTLTQMVDFMPYSFPYPINLYSLDQTSGALSASPVATLNNDQSFGIELDKSGSIGFMYGANPLDSVTLVGPGTLTDSNQNRSTHSGYGMSGKPYFNSLGTLSYQTLNTGTYFSPGTNSAISVFSINRTTGEVAELQTLSFSSSYDISSIFFDPSEKVLFAVINVSSNGYLASIPVNSNGALGSPTLYQTGASDGNSAHWFDPASDYLFVNASPTGSTITRSFLMHRTSAVLDGTLNSGFDSNVEMGFGEATCDSLDGTKIILRKASGTRIGTGHVSTPGTLDLIGSGINAPEALASLSACAFSPYDNTFFVIGSDSTASRLYSYSYDSAGNTAVVGSTVNLGAYAKAMSIFFTQPP